MQAVLAGNNCQNRVDLTSATARGYLSAGSNALTLLTQKPSSYLDPETLANKRPKVLPAFSELLRNRSAWSVPLAKKEPYTILMIDALRAWLSSESETRTLQVVFLTSEYAVYDWARLGFFTGSRISEYGQTSSSHSSTKSSRFACIPSSTDAGAWAGQALAFIAEDFTFYSPTNIRVDRKMCLLPSALDTIWYLHLRFRFDKSRQNFTIRKYTRLPAAPFDPVIVAINLLRRAYLLQIPSLEPLGQFRTQSLTTNSMLLDRHVRDVMRQACRLAYPDPEHYCRLHISGIVAHSNRVTAALCLHLGGASNEEIAFRLRWHVSSVPTYLRECFNGIDTIMQTAICGAFQS